MSDRAPTDQLVAISPPAPLPPTTPLPEQPAAPPPTTRRLPPLTWRDQAALAWRIWRDRLVRAWPALALGAGVGALLVALALAVQPGGPAARAGLIHAAPATSPTPRLAVPTPAPALPAGLLAYDQPGGALLGELPPGARYAVLAQAHGGAWLQVEAGAGPVWIEARAELSRPAMLADLTPPTPEPAPQIQVVYVQAPAPPPAQPAPPIIAPAPVAHDTDPPAELTPLDPPREARVEIDPDGGRWVTLWSGAGSSETYHQPPPGATPVPTPSWGPMHGGGGSWDD